MFGRFLLILTLATLIVAVVARTSSGHGPERVYVVRPADTLWSIASTHYGGDPREAVWRIERRNHLESALLRPGERLVLP
jgi:hypothetical protein